jgi:hypothetical protein
MNLPSLFKLELKMAAHEEVEFKTLDGLTLRGWLYPASKRGPGIIITPGVSQSQLQAPCIHFIARDQDWQALDGFRSQKTTTYNFPLSSSADQFSVQLC